MTGDLQNYLKARIDHDGPFEDLLRFPKYLEIETVNVCNARCPFCTIDDWDRHSPAMKMDLFHKIADEIIEHRHEIRRVSLYRDGEPLLDKKLPERIAYLKAGEVPCVAISTNVSLLNETRATEILSAGIDQVILSVDSLRKETFEKMRAGLNFETVRDNAIRFIELRDQLRPDTQIWMRMVADEDNHDEWPSYFEFWKDKLAQTDRLYKHSVHNWGGQLANGHKAMSYEPTLPCVALWSLMVVFSDGRVPLCNVDYNNLHPTGDVSQQSIADIWRSKVMNHRRELHLTGEKACIEPCANCNVWDEQSEAESPLISPAYGELVEIAVT